MLAVTAINSAGRPVSGELLPRPGSLRPARVAIYPAARLAGRERRFDFQPRDSRSGSVESSHYLGARRASIFFSVTWASLHGRGLRPSTLNPPHPMPVRPLLGWTPAPGGRR